MVLIRKILSSLLMLSIVLSTVGINFSFHTCSSSHVQEASISLFNIPSHYNSDECSVCSMPNYSESHYSENCDLSASDTESKVSFNEAECCKISNKYFHADLLIDAVKTLSNKIDIFINDIIIENFNIIDHDISLSLEILKHYSGVSPPYSHNYIHFKNSILE